MHVICQKLLDAIFFLNYVFESSVFPGLAMILKAVHIFCGEGTGLAWLSFSTLNPDWLKFLCGTVADFSALLLV